MVSFAKGTVVEGRFGRGWEVYGWCVWRRFGWGWACRIVITLRFPRGPVAQGLEQSAHNRSVGGSIPSGPTKLIDEAVGLCDQTLLAP